MTQQIIEEPSKGGSYVRNADGSLTLVESTEPAPARDKRKDQPSPAPTATSTPAKAVVAKQE